MNRFRWVLVVALVLALLITVPVGLWLVTLKREHPRDPAAFIYNLDHGMTSNGHSTFGPVPDGRKQHNPVNRPADRD